MNEDDLRRVLGSIDGADDDVPPAFADELWREVRTTLVRGRPNSERREHEVYDIVDGLSEVPGRTRTRPGWWLGRAAVLVLLVAGVTGLVLLRSEPGPRQIDEPTTTATDPTVPTSPAVLADPAEACRRFEESGPLAELSRRIADLGTNVSAIPELDTAVAALEVYVRDLEAAADATPPLVTASDVAPIRRALSSLRQAQLEVELGDLDRAARSVAAATSLMIEAPTPWC